MSSSQTPARFEMIDALRGAAMLWMTVFHFCFDLVQFGWLRANFYLDPFWIEQRSAIVSLFFLCAGLGQAIACQRQVTWRVFGRRWLQIVGCALLVSAASWWMFPGSYIYFGVLHGMAVMLLIARLSASWRAEMLGIAGLAVWVLHGAAPQLHALWPGLDFLNDRAWNWLGLISRKPITEDYVPLVPWLGTLWIGLAAGKHLMAHKPALLARSVSRRFKPLARLGRWSLSYYMVHQPVLLGLLMLAAYWR